MKKELLRYLLLAEEVPCKDCDQPFEQRAGTPLLGLSGWQYRHHDNILHQVTGPATAHHWRIPSLTLPLSLVRQLWLVSMTWSLLEQVRSFNSRSDTSISHSMGASTDTTPYVQAGLDWQQRRSTSSFIRQKTSCCSRRPEAVVVPGAEIASILD